MTIKSLIALIVCLFCSTAYSEITHVVSFNDKAHNYFEVESQFDVPEGQTQIDLVMATWTPGSYLVREYSRNVENIELEGAGELKKIAKNIWRASQLKGSIVKVKYRVYAPTRHVLERLYLKSNKVS